MGYNYRQNSNSLAHYITCSFIHSHMQNEKILTDHELPISSEYEQQVYVETNYVFQVLRYTVLHVKTIIY